MSDKRKTKTVEYLVSHMIQTDQPRMFCALELAEDYASKHGGPFCEIFRVTTEKVDEAINKPQVPEKAGEWWARLDLEDGEIQFGKTTLLPTGVIWWEAIGRTRACAVDPEDGDRWHKIELPKGWE